MASIHRVTTPVFVVAAVALALFIVFAGDWMHGETCHGAECGGIPPVVLTSDSDQVSKKHIVEEDHVVKTEKIPDLFKVSKDPVPEKLKSIAFCIPGDTKYLDVTAPNLVKIIRSLNAKVSVFVSTIFSEDTYKLKLLEDLNITAVNVHSIENLELAQFFHNVYSMENQDATDFAFDLKLGQDCLSMIGDEEKTKGEKFSVIAFSRMGHFWSKKSHFKKTVVSVLKDVEKSGKHFATMSFTAGVGDASSVKKFLAAERFFHILRNEWLETSKENREVRKQRQDRKTRLDLEHKWKNLVKKFKKENGATPKEILKNQFLIKSKKFATLNGPLCYLNISASGISVDGKSEDVYGRRCRVSDLKAKGKGKIMGKITKDVNFETCFKKLGTTLASIDKFEGPDAKQICARAQMGSTEHLGTDYGGWRLFLQRLNSGSHVFSVGVGQDISFDRQLIETFKCEVHAFDCTPVSMKWLKTQKTPKEWHHHPYLLGSEDGNLTLAMPTGFGTSFASLSANAKGFRQDVQRVTLPARTLTSLMKISNVDKIDVLKVDIEGGEFSVIKGWTNGKGSAPKACQILMEFHGRLLADGTRMRQNAFDHLRSIGFLSVGCSSDSFGSDDCLFFSPKECLGIV